MSEMLSQTIVLKYVIWSIMRCADIPQRADMPHLPLPWFPGAVSRCRHERELALSLLYVLVTFKLR